MKNTNGFTLVEMVVTLAVAAVLIGIGTPYLTDFIKDTRITAVNNDLVSALHVARSEAIRQNSFACVCPTADANAANPACSGAGTWETGWIAFLDNNGNCVMDGGAPADVLLKAWDGQKSSGQITVRTNDPTITSTNTVIFNSRGETQSGGLSQQGTFSICDSRTALVNSKGESVRSSAVILGVSGQVRSSRLAALINCP